MASGLENRSTAEDVVGVRFLQHPPGNVARLAEQATFNRLGVGESPIAAITTWVGIQIGKELDRPVEIIPKEFALRWGIPESSIYKASALAVYQF